MQPQQVMPGGLSPMPPSNQPFQPYPLPPGMAPPNPGQMPPIPKKHHPWGLIISLVMFILLFLGASGFGIWAFMGREDYKNNSDKKSAQAVTIAVQQEGTKKDKEFVEREKNPLKTYSGPEAFGSLHVEYPKTWSAYVVDAGRTATPIDGYFHPNFVPNVVGGTTFALRIQVTSQNYAQEMKQFEAKVKAGKVTVSPFTLGKVPGTAGARVQGELTVGQQVTMVLLPLRDKTIKVSTESQQFIDDFDNIILKNLSFIP